MDGEFYSRVHRFYETNRQGLYTYALSLTRDREAAEDAVQAAVSSLLQRGTLPADIRPYVFRSVRNAVVDGARAQRHGEAALLDPAAATNGQDPTRVRLLEQCLARLSDEERETVVLKALNGLTFREIAAIRKRTVNTVASWYRRGLAKMRTVLEEDL
jgi:RNA polymerase sigma-70 factor (ECF subfamily)